MRVVLLSAPVAVGYSCLAVLHNTPSQGRMPCALDAKKITHSSQHTASGRQACLSHSAVVGGPTERLALWHSTHHPMQP